MKFIFVILIATVFLACGSQRSLQKAYNGKPVESLHKEYGNPSTVIEQNGDSIYVFEKTQTLRSTEISQGKLTLDPIITPAVVKTERYYFTVKNGIITTVRTGEEYKR